MEQLQQALSSRGCFLCDPDNPVGPGLEFYPSEENPGEVVCRWTPGSQYQGQGNILHGALQAGIMDEIMGWVAHRTGKPGVTSSLEVRFLKPIRVGEELEARGREVSREGPKIHLEAELRNPEGLICARAQAVYHVLDQERFDQLVGMGGEQA